MYIEGDPTPIYTCLYCFPPVIFTLEHVPRMISQKNDASTA